MSAQKGSRSKSELRPEVIIDFIFENGVFFVSIENIGELPALNVTTTFDCKFFGLGGSTEISALPLFQLVEFLAPHKSIRTLLDSSSAYFNRNEPTRITARITYGDSRDRNYKTKNHHNLDIYKDITYLPEVKEHGRPS